MKRFYKNAGTSAVEDGFAVQLDGRNIKTPAKAGLVLPALALAEAVAVEWQAQGEEIDPQSMPIMTLASTVIDRVVPNHAEVAEIVASYGESDLLCYRATAEQPELVKRQQDAWQPWLDWAMRQLDAPLSVTEGIMHVDQPSDSLNALKTVVEACDAYELASLHEFTSLTGSLVLGIAVLKGELEAGTAFDLAHVDEEHQAELWGRDEEAEARLEKRKGDLLNAAEFLRFLRLA
ncbi:ATP12 family chaperone protein [Aestuariispira ectoiniformans]|uniref:ATP12 family chaperone protein n=1 Tax=Aestuariispira ectoiniformans TaxID=2775080 RepID=UPI00223BB305|nr:ATP12 family protein [Aestuariispira ectoiniformans]